MTDKLEIYYDHYKETCTLSKVAQERRNKSFVILCLLEALSFLMIRNPEIICGILNDAVRQQLETTIYISNLILETLVWFLIAYVLIRYVQDTLYIERQYNYLNLLEKKIARLLGESEKENIFTRESEFYNKDYPIVLNLIDLFYKMFVPILFTVINIIHIWQEWHKNALQLLLICDVAVCSIIIIITWFYFFEIHDVIAAWFMKCSLIRGITTILKGWLKVV